MALAIDASSPAVATQTTNTVATVVTASFTPPAGSLLLVLWSCDALGTPTAPSITDNLGTPLTYTRTDWQSIADAPTAHGQAAAWTAPVASSAAMTVTVTSGSASGERIAALKVLVLTGADTVTPVGAHGKSGSTSAASIAQSYTAQATSAWGFIGVNDFDQVGAETAGTGCTLIASANVGTAITYGFTRRTSADDVNGNSNTLNVTLPATSTNLTWVYVEIKPAAAAASTAPPQPIVVSVPASRPVASQGIVVRGSLTNPPVQTTPAPIVAALPPRQQLPAPAVVQRNTLVDPANPVPIVVSQPWLRTLPPAVTVARGDLVDPPVLTTPGPLVVARHVPAPLPTPAVVLRASLVDAAAPPAVATPPPIVAGLTAPWPPIPQPVTVRPARTDPPVATTPAPLVAQLPYSPPPIPAVVLVRSTLVDPVTPAPIVVWPPQRPPVVTPALIARGSLVDPPTQAPLVATWTWRPAPIAQPLLFRSSLADAAAPVASAAPPPLITRPPQWTFMVGSIIVRPLMVPCSCITLRPSTGTAAYNLATTARPDTGVTPDPCTC